MQRHKTQDIPQDTRRTATRHCQNDSPLPPSTMCCVVMWWHWRWRRRRRRCHCPLVSKKKTKDEVDWELRRRNMHIPVVRYVGRGGHMCRLFT